MGKLLVVSLSTVVTYQAASQDRHLIFVKLIYIKIVVVEAMGVGSQKEWSGKSR